MKNTLISLFFVSLFILTPQLSTAEYQMVSQELNAYYQEICIDKDMILRELRKFILLDSDFLIALVGTIIYMFLLSIAEIIGYGLSDLFMESERFLFQFFAIIIIFYTLIAHIGFIIGYSSFILKFMNDSDDVWCIILLYVVIIYSLLIQRYMLGQWTPKWRVSL